MMIGWFSQQLLIVLLWEAVTICQGSEPSPGGATPHPERSEEVMKNMQKVAAAVLNDPCARLSVSGVGSWSRSGSMSSKDTRKTGYDKQIATCQEALKVLKELPDDINTNGCKFGEAWCRIQWKRNGFAFKRQHVCTVVVPRAGVSRYLQPNMEVEYSKCAADVVAELGDKIGDFLGKHPSSE